MNTTNEKTWYQKYGQNSKKYQIKRRIYLKQKCIDILGGKCVICGYNKCHAAMDFHHINPLEKKRDMGRLIMKGYAEKTIFEELKKCILLCVRCHREFHAGIITLPI